MKKKADFFFTFYLGKIIQINDFFSFLEFFCTKNWLLPQCVGLFKSVRYEEATGEIILESFWCVWTVALASNGNGRRGWSTSSIQWNLWKRAPPLGSVHLVIALQFTTKLGDMKIMISSSATFLTYFHFFRHQKSLKSFWLN